MPIPIEELFEAVGLECPEPVSWGSLNNPPFDSKNGIYVIASPSPKFILNINETVINEWLNRVRTSQFGLINPLNDDTFKQCAINALKSYLVPNEQILYIGKSKNVKKRLKQFHYHKIGNCSPHRGGQWLKTLNNLEQLYVYCQYTGDELKIEREMINIFRDRCNMLPFANIKYWDNICNKWKCKTDK